MKSIILILLIVGLLLMVKGYTENYKNCPLPKIEYRYIPRNFYEEQITENNLKSLYSDMFNKSDTWGKYRCVVPMRRSLADEIDTMLST